MATRGTISILNLDGTVETVYSHWDNYLECNGAILQKYYNTTESVQNLIDNGDISSLGRKVSDTKLDFDGKDHDYTRFYSYRNENCPKRVWSSLDDYYKNQQTEEYNYMFNVEDGVWSVTYYENDWQDLEFLIQEKEIKDPYSKE